MPMPDEEPRNIIHKIVNKMLAFFQYPGDIVKHKIVEPFQQDYPWYHQKFRRVPTIDQCYTDDLVCYQEANQQYQRDRMVDSQILAILRQRFEDCVMYESPDHMKPCAPLMDTYEIAATNWFIKYGDLGAYHDVKVAYMKQKHRMLWERRHGPVGSGMKESN